jgi:hypothetical protein
MADRRPTDRKRAISARRPVAKVAAGQQAQLQTLSFSRKNWILFGAGIASVCLGFLLLRLGDITLAPILLLAGYLVLIPWSLIARQGPPRRPPDRDPGPPA